ncbi:hypothetical protein ACIQF6_35400 [Kitasatospora sp. NPDC092948]|uniref:hypothetical protein n=1 Tax=Kitasatospora sp. NPDC092948 TaxID=3364088 RepID=UPI003830A843
MPMSGPLDDGSPEPVPATGVPTAGEPEPRPGEGENESLPAAHQGVQNGLAIIGSAGDISIVFHLAGADRAGQVDGRPFSTAALAFGTALDDLVVQLGSYWRRLAGVVDRSTTPPDSGGGTNS